MEKPTTAQEIARETGRSWRTVRWHCQQLGLPKIGGQYIMDAQQAQAVRDSLRAKTTV